MWTDAHTDTKTLIVAFGNFANAREVDIRKILIQLKLLNLESVNVDFRFVITLQLLSHKVHCVSFLFTEGSAEHRVSSGGDQSESSYPRQQPAHVQEPPSEKQWNYSSLDLMGSGAAFWQNYSG